MTPSVESTLGTNSSASITAILNNGTTTTTTAAPLNNSSVTTSFNNNNNNNNTSSIIITTTTSSKSNETITSASFSFSTVTSNYKKPNYKTSSIYYLNFYKTLKGNNNNNNALNFDYSNVKKNNYLGFNNTTFYKQSLNSSINLGINDSHNSFITKPKLASKLNLNVINAFKTNNYTNPTIHVGPKAASYTTTTPRRISTTTAISPLFISSYYYYHPKKLNVTNFFLNQSNSFKTPFYATNHHSTTIASTSAFFPLSFTTTSTTTSTHAKTLFLFENDYNQSKIAAKTIIIDSFLNIKNVKSFKSQFKISENFNKYLSNKTINNISTYHDATIKHVTSTLPSSSSSGITGYASSSSSNNLLKNLNKLYSKPLVLVNSFIERFSTNASTLLSTSTTTTTTTSSSTPTSSSTTTDSIKKFASNIYVDKYHEKIYNQTTISGKNGSATIQQNTKSKLHYANSTSILTTKDSKQVTTLFVKSQPDQTNHNNKNETISTFKPTIIYSDIKNIKEKYKSFLKGKKKRFNR